MDTYDELRKASNEELLEALLHHYNLNMMVTNRGDSLIRLGFALAQEDGWTRVAPKWLEDYRRVAPEWLKDHHRETNK